MARLLASVRTRTITTIAELRKSLTDTRSIAVTGMLLAVMLLITFMPFLNFQIGPLRVTLLHIPVLIGVIAEGLPVGLILGGAFGIISLLRAFSTPSATSFVLQNPIIAILPRLLIPVVAYLVTRSVRAATKRSLIAETAGAFCGAATNTVLVLSLIALLYGERYGLAMQGLGRLDALHVILFSTALTNGLPEAVVAAIMVPAVIGALRRARLTPKDVA
ncbi:MAG: ECF transporter S component [Oscillospiraceae bacterium]|nr:ECF transporter S component [Oscillospiraceae bacterium]